MLTATKPSHVIWFTDYCITKRNGDSQVFGNTPYQSGNKCFLCLLVENLQIWYIEYLLYFKIFPMPLGKIFIIQKMLNLDSLDLFIMPNVRIKKKIIMPNVLRTRSGLPISHFLDIY